MKDGSKRESMKQAEAESGTKRDVKGMDGRHPHMRHSHHEMGEYREGSDHHDCHRGKS